MALDAQTIVDTVAASDETTALSILQAVIQSRPEFAASIASMLVPDLTYPPAKALTEKRARGTVKSMNDMKGYGFIECAELHAVFGADVFVHHKQANGLKPGQPVSFAVMLNKDNKPQGYDLQPEGEIAKGYDKGCGKGKGKGGDAWNAMGKGGDSGEDPASMMMSMMAAMMGGESGDNWGGKGGKGDSGDAWGGKGGKGDGKDFGKGKKNESGVAKPNVVEVVGEFQGTIKSFNPKNGYGFIECPDLKEVGCPNDVFLHHQQLNGFEMGSQIQFTCYMNRNGQPQAKDLCAVQGDAKKLKMW